MLKIFHVVGVAYEGEICGDKLNVGYVGDDGNYGGVLTATHELGHLWVYIFFNSFKTLFFFFYS